MNQTFHLTDDQMYDLLEPAANAPTPSHLQNCPECQAEFATLRESLLNFRRAATNLAAAAAPTRPPIAARVPSWFFGAKVWAASFATATAVLAVSISVLHPVHMGAGASTSAAVSTPQSAVTGESDEALLDGIQRDLSTSIPPSLEPLAVPAASSETSTQN